MKIRTVRDLSTAIKGRRTDLGWSQHDLAHRADAGASAVRQIGSPLPARLVDAISQRAAHCLATL